MAAAREVARLVAAPDDERIGGEVEAEAEPQLEVIDARARVERDEALAHDRVEADHADPARGVGRRGRGRVVLRSGQSSVRQQRKPLKS